MPRRVKRESQLPLSSIHLPSIHANMCCVHWTVANARFKLLTQTKLADISVQWVAINATLIYLVVSERLYIQQNGEALRLRLRHLNINLHDL